MSEWLQTYNEFFGMYHAGIKSEIVPSNKDRFLRKETLLGFVHDEASAFFGGLAGNAGLFRSSALPAFYSAC